ncbi:TetR/AcrR family transcriptional regulator [Nonomuraea sp. NPDC049152]|uniref:TetR/AcrR family transcriptional regulator n=1 Tax=Nonomuraea sp. NPDC049152 TaxID=3154350 RepID=UPI003405DAD3
MKRLDAVAEAAITLLAERGMRGLTHRAVDEFAGLPPGSTSNLARTRAALLELTLQRLTELEAAALAPAMGLPGERTAAPGAGSPAERALTSSLTATLGKGPAAGPGPTDDEGAGVAGGEGGARGSGVAELLEWGDLAGLMAELLWVQLADRRRTLARYELALEATRRPELREIYDMAGARFRDPAVALLAAAGSRDPVRHGRQLVAYGEGVMFDAIAGAGVMPSIEDLRAGLSEFLSGMLS